EYSRLVFAGLLYQPRPERILVVGLGGGVIPRELHHYYPRAKIDVVEIDPAIPRVARRFFRFPDDPRINVHVADGRAFIEKVAAGDDGQKYDLIVLDAYGEGSIPFHLLTREFLQTVKSIRASDGAIVSNLIRTHRLFGSELKTYRTVFRAAQGYVGTESTNVILVAPGKQAPIFSKDEAYRRARRLQRRREFAFSLPEVAGHLNTGLQPGQNAVVLIDNMARGGGSRSEAKSREREGGPEP
ncbi:MAG: fused MFS/spermidine synthase, partial [Planctomycetota bacterium]